MSLRYLLTKLPVFFGRFVTAPDNLYPKKISVYSFHGKVYRLFFINTAHQTHRPISRDSFIEVRILFVSSLSFDVTVFIQFSVILRYAVHTGVCYFKPFLRHLRIFSSEENPVSWGLRIRSKPSLLVVKGG